MSDRSSSEISSSLKIPTQISRRTWDWLRLRSLRSALARLRFREERNNEDSFQRRTDEERAFALISHSGTKGDATAPLLNGAKYFSFEDLKQCTDNFSINNKIGEDGFGKIYKGCCTDGVVIAVKRLRETIQGTNSFQSEIEVLSRVHHKNIVRLVGFCFEKEEQLVVYEYMSKGTLRDSLAGNGNLCLDWEKRLQIALDSARGLAYLHELANPLIIHRDVKSKNILLDGDLNAKVTEFGVSKMVSQMEKGHVSFQGRGMIAQVETEVIVGTYGYLDPEYVETGLLSEKSDVYSFGVVILELITARSPSIAGSDGITFLVPEVMRTIDENDQKYYGLRDMIDPKIINQVTSVGLRKFVQLALQCVSWRGSDRPSMYEIMKEIDLILQHDESERTANVDYSDDIRNTT